MEVLELNIDISQICRSKMKIEQILELFSILIKDCYENNGVETLVSKIVIPEIISEYMYYPTNLKHDTKGIYISYDCMVNATGLKLEKYYDECAYRINSIIESLLDKYGISYYKDITIYAYRVNMLKNQIPYIVKILDCDSYKALCAVRMFGSSFYIIDCSKNEDGTCKLKSDMIKRDPVFKKFMNRYINPQKKIHGDFNKIEYHRPFINIQFGNGDRDIFDSGSFSDIISKELFDMGKITNSIVLSLNNKNNEARTCENIDFATYVFYNKYIRINVFSIKMLKKVATYITKLSQNNQIELCFCNTYPSSTDINEMPFLKDAIFIHSDIVDTKFAIKHTNIFTKKLGTNKKMAPEFVKYLNEIKKTKNFKLSEVLTMKEDCLREAINDIPKTGDDMKTDIGLFDDIIGLNDIKAHILKYVKQFKMDKIRKEHGLPIIPLKKHMVFKGNPGTSKTTIATILTELLYREGVVNKKELVKLGKPDLVGRYVGHTAPQAKEILEKNRGSVILIDEAYALSPKGSTDFSNDTIVELIQFLESCDDTIVIFAGYPKEMEGFLGANPGLRNRIGHFLDFKDYSKDELMDIAEKMYSKGEITIDDDCKSVIENMIMTDMKTKNFGNGRYIRNIVEQSILAQSSRLSDTIESGGTISKDDLCKIKSDDIITQNTIKEKRIGIYND